MIAEIDTDERIFIDAAHAEAHRERIRHIFGVNDARHSVAHTALGFQLDAARKRLCGFFVAALHVLCGGTACLRGFFGNIVHKVVHMQHVAAREDARHAGLEAFVDNGAVRHTGERCARAEGEFVFRDQTDGQKQRIARIILFRARDRL